MSGERRAASDGSEAGGGRGAQLKHTGLRPGWTTGACATAATTAAYTALLTGDFPDPVTITLPRGQTPAFALATEELTGSYAMAGIVKDAGDDPDVTHGALVRATVRLLPAGSGVVFRAGPGVGTVTRPGLPLPVGEPAVNPVPRQLMREHVARVAAEHGKGIGGGGGDVEITVSVDHGEEIARSTWNPRLGILGGLSILGTTGIVVPYSCSAWIDSIRRGVDVARAAGHTHVAGCTGSTSEKTVVAAYGLPEQALLDMGDFAGAVLKYVRRHPVDRLTICGGFAKLSKLAAGHLDLHSARSQVDLGLLAELARRGGASETLAAEVADANTGLAALQLCAAAGVPLGDLVAVAARDEALTVLRGAPVAVDVICIDRAGGIVGRSGVSAGGRA
ncbi:cobalt-precorrin-5B (C(1))-methyltransferase [Streptomyces sp. WI04-05B]|uniref:cobalt-precorrin-5B (C(1))-methyltransferase n=1 Tax=Streptomyces TaxID=1883 RepID=UPI0029BAFF5C|nr:MULTISPECIES: cobalt-precorrin-5B (C(1))-methyltransferase [unclassified Streptomyces]MDX2544223.1 cobalt-precorrin-5B (C(1))-methyltransferase [Streptomyces sp. WI04-05B]MDX2584639.1 cobalt-precorrin-5B (C(1))-methyltransferase [Streptomyces sp. WI04-05A]MDX3749466.1 cobalt-precorrin-5B (C(1))-methyltransferase [Streptomyces sp. AK08-02]